MLYYKSGEQTSVSIPSNYEGMTELYFDNYPDYITAQIDYLEKHMNFEKYGINYSRTKEF